MTHYGLFNDESPDYTEDSAVEAGFYSIQEAQAAIADRYSDEDGLEIHEVEDVEADDLNAEDLDESGIEDDEYEDDEE